MQQSWRMLLLIDLHFGQPGQLSDVLSYLRFIILAPKELYAKVKSVFLFLLIILAVPNLIIYIQIVTLLLQTSKLRNMQNRHKKHIHRILRQRRLQSSSLNHNTITFYDFAALFANNIRSLRSVHHRIHRTAPYVTMYKIYFRK